MVLLLLALAGAVHPVLGSRTGELTVDGVVATQGTAACRSLRGADAIVAAESDLHTVVVQSKACGARSIGLSHFEERIWFQLGAAGHVALYVDSRETYWLLGGSRTPFFIQHLKSLSKLSPDSAHLTFVFAANLEADLLARAGAMVSKRVPHATLHLAGSYDELDASVRGVARASAGLSFTQTDEPNRTLTRELGRSWAATATQTGRKVPKWTKVSSLVCKDRTGVVAWGVGTVSGIRNHSLARTTADNRARAALAKLVNVTIERGPNSLRTHSSATLQGVQIVDHYVGADGTTSSLALKEGGLPAGVTAKTTCPTGHDVVHNVQWRPVAADEAASKGPHPAWLSASGISVQQDHLQAVLMTTPTGPFAQARTQLADRVRGVLAERLTLGLSTTDEAMPHATDGRDCLGSLPWNDIAQAVDPEVHWHSDTGSLHARGRISRSELADALPHGCDAGAVSNLFDAAGRATGSSAAITAPPHWLTRGTGTMTRGQERFFNGVGAASGIRNRELAKSTADRRARVELAKVFEVFSALLLKSYLTDKNYDEGAKQRYHDIAFKTLPSAVLSGSMITEHWTGPDRTLYALAQLNLNALLSALDSIKDLDAAYRRHAEQEAAGIHGMLAR